MPVLMYPVQAPVRITQPFGARPEYYRQFGLPGHEGIDFGAATGAQVLCAWDGHVILVAEYGNYGYQVRVRSDEGNRQYEHVYAHGMRGSSFVKKGQFVKVGEVLMRADSTGNVQGGHLHFTLKCYGATVRKETTYPFDIIDPTDLFMALQGGEGGKTDRVRVIANPRLRVREEPSLKSHVVGYVLRGAVLDLTGRQGNWGSIAEPAGWIDLSWTELVTA